VLATEIQIQNNFYSIVYHDTGTFYDTYNMSKVNNTYREINKFQILVNLQKVRSYIGGVLECHKTSLQAESSLAFFTKTLSSSITFKAAGSLLKIHAAMISGFCASRCICTLP